MDARQCVLRLQIQYGAGSHVYGIAQGSWLIDGATNLISRVSEKMKSGKYVMNMLKSFIPFKLIKMLLTMLSG